MRCGRKGDAELDSALRELETSVAWDSLPLHELRVLLRAVFLSP